MPLPKLTEEEADIARSWFDRGIELKAHWIAVYLRPDDGRHEPAYCTVEPHVGDRWTDYEVVQIIDMAQPFDLAHYDFLSGNVGDEDD